MQPEVHSKQEVDSSDEVGPTLVDLRGSTPMKIVEGSLELEKDTVEAKETSSSTAQQIQDSSQHEK